MLSDIRKRIVFALNRRNMLDFLSDKAFLKLMFYVRMGKKLNLKNPTTFNEKLQWLKLYDRKPLYTTMVDKYEVKKYVGGIIGEEYIIPTLGVWEKFEEIDFSTLPEQFVLKCTHDSGGLVICKDKSNFDIPSAREKIDRCLHANYYRHGREWPYKNVQPRIIAEKYMEDDSRKLPAGNEQANSELKDYKLFCFNGEPKITLVCSGRYSELGLQEDFFDERWEHLPVKRPCHPNVAALLKKPETLEQMQALARQLSEHMPFVRVDFYEINGHVYFGEMTLYPASGMVGFEPTEWDQKLGAYIRLPKEN